MDQAVLSGALNLPQYQKERRIHQAVKWIPQGWQWVDPQKEFNAVILAIRAGLLSRSEAVSTYGYDIEEIDREIAADNKRADDQGLVFDSDPRKVNRSGSRHTSVTRTNSEEESNDAKEVPD